MFRRSSRSSRRPRLAVTKRQPRSPAAWAKRSLSTLHLHLLDLLGEAALEIGGQLESGRVEVRLAGREPELVVVTDEVPDAGAGRRRRGVFGPHHASTPRVAEGGHRSSRRPRRRLDERVARANDRANTRSPLVEEKPQPNAGLRPRLKGEHDASHHHFHSTTSRSSTRAIVSGPRATRPTGTRVRRVARPRQGLGERRCRSSKRPGASPSRSSSRVVASWSRRPTSRARPSRSSRSAVGARTPSTRSR